MEIIDGFGCECLCYSDFVLLKSLEYIYGHNVASVLCMARSIRRLIQVGACMKRLNTPNP